MTTSFFDHLWSANHLTNTITPLQRNLCSTKTNPDNLPSLPVPPLKDTLNRYIKSVEPLLTKEELAQTKSIVQRFENDDGLKLHDLLEKRAKSKENWLSDWWLSSAYLSYRDSVVLMSSPGLAFPKQNFQSEGDRINYAAKMVSAALLYREIIVNKKMPHEKVGKALLDMAQYDRIFGTCRIPGIEKDSLIFNTNSKHFVLFYKNNVSGNVSYVSNWMLIAFSLLYF